MTLEQFSTYIIGFIDIYSGWPETFSMPAKTTDNVAHLLIEEIIPRHSEIQILTSVLYNAKKGDIFVVSLGLNRMTANALFRNKSQLLGLSAVKLDKISNIMENSIIKTRWNDNTSPSFWFINFKNVQRDAK
jgi:hypothetical protein